MKKRSATIVALAIFSVFIVCSNAGAGLYNPATGIWTSNEIGVFSNSTLGSQFESLPLTLALTGNTSAEIYMRLTGGVTPREADTYIDIMRFSSWSNVGQFPKDSAYRGFSAGLIRRGSLDEEALRDGLLIRAGYPGTDALPIFGATLVVYGLTGDYTPVPIPAAVWLLGSGLVGLVALRRRMKK